MSGPAAPCLGASRVHSGRRRPAFEARGTTNLVQQHHLTKVVLQVAQCRIVRAWTGGSRWTGRAPNAFNVWAGRQWRAPGLALRHLRCCINRRGSGAAAGDDATAL